MSAGDRELLGMEFVEGETFQARLERGPLPQHDVMGLGQAIASGLTASTAIRSSSNRFSQLASWFQLAKLRLTTLSSALSDGVKARLNRFPGVRDFLREEQLLQSLSVIDLEVVAAREIGERR